MKFLFIIFFTMSLVSCQKEEVKKKTATKISYDFDAKENQNSAENFDDFKKVDDESCADEEEIKKKLIPEKPKAFQLQGGDAGCDISELDPKTDKKD